MEVPGVPRIGVTNIEVVTRIGPPGAEQLYLAKLACFIELRRTEGRHMSRFEEVVNDVIGEVMLGATASRPSSWPSRSPSRCANARTPSVPR